VLPLASHVKYAPRALLRLEMKDESDRRSDGRQRNKLNYDPSDFHYKSTN